MASSSLTFHIFYTHSHSRHKSNQFPPISFNPNPNFIFRSRSLPDSKNNPNPSNSTSNSSPPSNKFTIPPLLRLGDAIKVDELGREMVSISVPAALAVAADPITSLVDTAFVGHLGSAELAAVGVLATVFNFVSKLFNIPLLNVTTSFVAEEQALIIDQSKESLLVGQDLEKCKRVFPSVSTSLILAAGLGLVEAMALSAGSGFLMNIMGIAVVCLENWIHLFASQLKSSSL